MYFRNINPHFPRAPDSPISTLEMKIIPITLMLAFAGCVLSSERNFKDVKSVEVDSSEYGMKPGHKQTTCKCGWANKRPKSRIIFGIDATESEFPWAVSLQYISSSFHFCGGSIITPWHVISAAHCTFTKKPEHIKVVVGATNLIKSKTMKSIPVVRILNHDYQKKPTRRDISILVLGSKIQYSKIVGPICLPNKEPAMVGKYITAVGWGRMAANETKRDKFQLKKAHMRVVDKEGCTKFWPTQYDSVNGSHICTWSHKTDICMGDSGGPVTWVDPDTNRYFLVGLPSMCDVCRLKLPSIHTAVHYYWPWIRQVISEHEHAKEKVCTKA